jgi:hypothetical protein
MPIGCMYYYELISNGDVFIVDKLPSNNTWLVVNTSNCAMHPCIGFFMLAIVIKLQNLITNFSL